MLDIKNEPKYHIIKNFLTKEEAEVMLSEMKANSEVDRKPGFMFYPIPGSEDDFLRETVSLPWDPNKKIKALLEFSKQFIKENYNLWGDIYFRRVHGNAMLPEIDFPSHTDEDPSADGLRDGSKRTYVADLFLNDDHEGGELGFNIDGKEEVIKPEAGDLIIFPGYLIPHWVTKVVSGERWNIMAIYYDIPEGKDPDSLLSADTKNSLD